MAILILEGQQYLVVETEGGYRNGRQLHSETVSRGKAFGTAYRLAKRKGMVFSDERGGRFNEYLKIFAKWK